MYCVITAYFGPLSLTKSETYCSYTGQNFSASESDRFILAAMIFFLWERMSLRKICTSSQVMVSCLLAIGLLVIWGVAVCAEATLCGNRKTEIMRKQETTRMRFITALSV